MAATADQVQVAVSDDAKNASPKVADFTFAMKTPLTTVPTVGSNVNISGTYSSYTSAASPASAAADTTVSADASTAAGTQPASSGSGSQTAPFMIQMSDGALVEKPAAKAPTRRPATTTTRRRTR